jgi:hypothetical protein
VAGLNQEQPASLWPESAVEGAEQATIFSALLNGSQGEDRRNFGEVYATSIESPPFLVEATIPG